MSKQKDNKETQTKPELYTLLPVVLNVFSITTIYSSIIVCTKNKLLNDVQKKSIEDTHGKIRYIEKGGIGFNENVIYI